MIENANEFNIVTLLRTDHTDSLVFLFIATPLQLIDVSQIFMPTGSVFVFDERFPTNHRELEMIQFDDEFLATSI